jgi:hypothetical protein
MVQQAPNGTQRKGQGMGLGSRLRLAIKCPCLLKVMGGSARRHDTSTTVVYGDPFSAKAGSEVTMSAFRAGALRELCVELVRGNEVAFLEAISVNATAGGTAATPGMVAPTADVE